MKVSTWKDPAYVIKPNFKTGFLNKVNNPSNEIGKQKGISCKSKYKQHWRDLLRLKWRQISSTRATFIDISAPEPYCQWIIFDGQNILCSSSPITAQEDYFDDVDVVAYFPVMVRKINAIKLQVHNWQNKSICTEQCIKIHTSTHWGGVTHICAIKIIIIVSDDGLSPDRRQTIIWTNVGILLIGPRKLQSKLF